MWNIREIFTMITYLKSKLMGKWHEFYISLISEYLLENMLLLNSIQFEILAILKFHKRLFCFIPCVLIVFYINFDWTWFNKHIVSLTLYKLNIFPGKWVVAMQTKRSIYMNEWIIKYLSPLRSDLLPCDETCNAFKLRSLRWVNRKRKFWCLKRGLIHGKRHQARVKRGQRCKKRSLLHRVGGKIDNLWKLSYLIYLN